MLQITLTIVPVPLSVPVSHDSATMSQHAQFTVNKLQPSLVLLFKTALPTMTKMLSGKNKSGRIYIPYLLFFFSLPLFFAFIGVLLPPVDQCNNEKLHR